jgi:hypothetical protein
MPNVKTKTLVRDLLMYVHANPDASDSAQGIARWWLDPVKEVDVQVLADALTFLVDNGVFAERVAADGRRSYRRSCSDATLIELLASLQPPVAPSDDSGA